MTDAPEFLTVPELAELLRIKERKVYDLAASGKVPCTRATGKLLFPADDVQTWLAGKTPRKAARPNVFLGSHDPLLEWALRQSRCGLATFLDGSTDGVTKFCAGEGIATGLHLHDSETGDWNVPTVSGLCAGLDVVLITWAIRARGIVVAGDKSQAIKAVADLAGKKIATRSPQAGTATFFEHVTRDVPEMTKVGPYHSEQDAVLAVSEGAADATLGLETVARQFGLGFVPVVDERFDLLVDRKAYFEAPMQTLLAFCQSEDFRKRAATLGGYDLSDLGKVRWNA